MNLTCIVLAQHVVTEGLPGLDHKGRVAWLSRDGGCHACSCRHACC
jgi:hypothetical protein